MKKITAAFAGIGLALAFGASSAFAADKPAAEAPASVKTEAAWVASLQNASGGILMYSRQSPSNKITPYFANIAASGMAQSKKELGGAKRYMDWYFAHLNEPDRFGLRGTVYDYAVDASGKEIPTNDYDSADSYAATFISLVRDYRDNGGDERYILSHKKQIEEVAGVMSALTDKDGLSIAKKHYPVKFLMDNTEVYKGLLDMSYLSLAVFKDPAQAAYYYKLSEASKTAILTQFANGSEFYVYINGAYKKPAVWSSWYPDSTSQLFPALNGVIRPDSVQAKKLYAKFNQYNPEWEKLKKADPFPWAVVGYAAALMGDHAKAEAYLKSANAAYLQKGHIYPWYNAESGWLIKMMRTLDSHRGDDRHESSGDIRRERD